MVVPRLAHHSATLESIGPKDISSAMLDDSIVTTDKILDGTIKSADINMSVSAEITANGSAQSTAHGLGVTPSIVLALSTTNGAAGAFVVTYGTHTSTNSVITITTGAKYKILAIA